LLPVPGELPTTNETSIRLRHLGRIGRSLCERPGSGPSTGASSPDAMAEARLFFDYLCEDYQAALDSLEALETRLTSSDQRLRLLGVRAQIFLGLMQTDQAIKTISFLRSIDVKPGQRIEESPLGPMLTTDAGSNRRWATYLSERTVSILNAGSATSTEVPLGHRNPDNPNPNADFVPGPAGGPIPFAPMIRVVPRFMPRFPEFEVQAEADMRRRPFVPPQPPHLPRAGQPAPRP
jgi:hypothetical protein